MTAAARLARRCGRRMPRQRKQASCPVRSHHSECLSSTGLERVSSGNHGASPLHCAVPVQTARFCRSARRLLTGRPAFHVGFDQPRAFFGRRSERRERERRLETAAAADADNPRLSPRNSGSVEGRPPRDRVRDNGALGRSARCRLQLHGLDQVSERDVVVDDVHARTRSLRAARCDTRVACECRQAAAPR